MPFAVIDGINTRYEVVGSGPPLLMYSPGGFDATLEKWSVLGVYAKTWMMDHLPKRYACIIFDRRDPSHATSAARYLEECLPKSQYWDALPEAQTEETAPSRLLGFLTHGA